MKTDMFLLPSESLPLLPSKDFEASKLQRAYKSHIARQTLSKVKTLTKNAKLMEEIYQTGLANSKSDFRKSSGDESFLSSANTLAHYNLETSPAQQLALTGVKTRAQTRGRGRPPKVEGRKLDLTKV